MRYFPIKSRWPLGAAGILALAGAAFFFFHGGRQPFGGEELGAGLSSQRMSVRLYSPAMPCRAVILFASGDGGWTSFEDRICRSLSSRGFAVAGWDFLRYAKAGAYDQRMLSADFSAVLEETKRALGIAGPVPVIFAGYSSGAEQAAAAGAFAPRPPGLAGLLLISPGERGRYGISLSDLMGFTPRGAGSFAMADLAPSLSELRIVQIHGEHDPLDSTEWLKRLDATHDLKTYPGGWHFFKGGPPDFLRMLDDAIDWILES
jgi:type IV secretory pathway VirJ component